MQAKKTVCAHTDCTHARVPSHGTRAERSQPELGKVGGKKQTTRMRKRESLDSLAACGAGPASSGRCPDTWPQESLTRPILIDD